MLFYRRLPRTWKQGRKKGFDFLAQGNMSSAAVDAMKLLGSTKIGSYYVLSILFWVRVVYWLLVLFSFFLWTVFFLVDCCFLFITVTRWKVHLKSWCFCPNCTQDLCTIVSKERSHGLTYNCPTPQVATVVCLNDVCRGNKSLKMKTFLSPQAASAPWPFFMLCCFFPRSRRWLSHVQLFRQSRIHLPQFSGVQFGFEVPYFSFQMSFCSC